MQLVCLVSELNRIWDCCIINKPVFGSVFKLCSLSSCLQFDGGRILIEVWFVFCNVRVHN